MKKFLWFSLFYLFMFSAFVIECSGGGADKYGREKSLSSDDEDSALEAVLRNAPVWTGPKLGLSSMVEGYHATARMHAGDSDDDEHAGGGGGKERSFSRDDEDCFGDDDSESQAASALDEDVENFWRDAVPWTGEGGRDLAAYKAGTVDFGGEHAGGGADKYGNTASCFSSDDDWGDSDDDESASATAAVDPAAAFWGSSATWSGDEGIDLDSMVAAYRANPVGADADSEDEPVASGASELVDAIVTSLAGLELEDDDQRALRKLRLLIQDLEHDLEKKVSDEKKLNLEQARTLLANYALMIQNEIDLNNQMDDLADDEVVAANLIDSKLQALTLNIDQWRVQVDNLTSKYEIMKSGESEDKPLITAKRTKSRDGRGSSGGGGGGGGK